VLGPNGSSNSNEYEDATYDGMWQSGKRHGQGTCVWADGATYTGTWHNDMRHNGEMKFHNGMIYYGDYYNDKMHGQGRLYMTTGIIFVG
jgi:hypothetical protein